MRLIVKVITLNHPHNINKDLPPLAIALGFFDGVHLGHQKVILAAKQYADENNLASAVMTFDPHPTVVLSRNRKQVKYITPVNDKIKLIEQFGIDYLFIVHFTESFAQLLPQQFIDQYIIDLNVKHVVSGFDYTYGRMGKGTTETMPFHSRKAFTQSIVPKLAKDNNTKISSTLIRSKIVAGDVDQIPDLLGRFFTITGTVVHGDNRGRTMGFPTANIQVSKDYLLPPVGVYTVRVKIGEKIYNGVCNVGYVPTFNKDKNRMTIEVHLFDFNDNIYGKKVTIEWHERSRKEKRFKDVQQLIDQISSDKERAINYFKENKFADF